MKIILIRHGQCSTNGSYTGRGSDVAINESGKSQIEELSIKISKTISNESIELYSSDLLRAKESASILSKKLALNRVNIDNRLDEIHFGDWEGLNYDQIMRGWPDLARSWYNNPLEVTPPNAEDFTNFYNRIKSFYSDILMDTKLKRSTVLIVCHGGVIQLLSTLVSDDIIKNRWNYDIPRGTYRVFEI